MTESEAERYARVNDIVGGARELRGADLETYLVAACGDDPSVRAEVDELLALAGDDDPSAALAESDLESGRRALDAFLVSEVQPWLPDKIGDYTILRQIGQGGMGIVYEATQQSPQRSVAIKLLHPIHATEDRMRRFRHEVELLGRLQHPGIAQIFEASTYDIGRGPQPFFAMELVLGVDIRAHSERHGLGRDARIELLAKVADAVEYAHGHGVVHRDLKPDNVLVNELGQPRVLDFGIAHATDQTPLSTMMTEKGQLVGTLGYMAPEQLSTSTAVVTPLADVYALGVLGFELLTRRLPCNVADLPVSKAIALLADTDAPPAGKFVPSLKGDVETILGKALETDPERRYPSAAAFAGDLRRFLAHEPIEARPPSRVYLVRKFARRHRVLVGGVAATLAVAIAGAIIATGYAFDAANRAAELERAAYVSGIAAASSAIQMQDYGTAATFLDHTPVRHRGWEYGYLRARLVHYSADWPAPAPVVTRPVFDRDGKHMFAVMANASIGTWDTSTGRLLRTLALDKRVVALPGIVLHGAARRFAASLATGELAIGDLDSGELQVIPEPAVHIMAWDTSGQRLLFRSDKVRIWDGAGAGSRIVTDELLRYGAFNFAGDRITLVAGRDIALHATATGDVLARGKIDDIAQDIAFAPDGKTIAIACYNRNVFLLDGESLDILARLAGHEDIVLHVAWTADGQLVTTSNDQTVRVWSKPVIGSSDVYVPGAQEQPWDSAVDPTPSGLAKVGVMTDDSHVVVVGDRIRLLPLRDPTVLRGHDTFVYQLTFSPDGSLLASSAFHQSEIRLWDVNRGRLRWRLGSRKPFVGGEAPRIAFAEGGQRLVADLNRGLQQWDVDSGEVLPITSVHPDRAAQFLETVGLRRDDLFWKPDWDVSRDGQMSAISNGAVVDLRQRIAGAKSEAWRPTDMAQFVAKPTGRLKGHRGQVYCVAFHPDGTRIATGGNDATVRIWDAHTCEQLLVLRGHEQYVKDVAWSPDGTLLASASGDTTIRLWDSTPLHERRAMQRR